MSRGRLTRTSKPWGLVCPLPASAHPKRWGCTEGDPHPERGDRRGDPATAGENNALGNGQPLGIGLPGDERRQNRPAAGAQDVADHARQLHVRVFERFLQPLRVPGGLADQLLAGPRQVAQFLDRGRRHEAAPNQPVRQQVGDPRRVLPVALAARNVPDVLRVGQHQRQRRFVFEDVPHRLPVHAGRLHRHVRAAGLGQPGHQCEQPRRRGRELPSGPPRCARRRSAPRVAHRACKTSIRHLLTQGGWHGVRRYGIYKTRSPGEPASQYGVLAGLRAKLVYGLFGAKEQPTSVPASRATQYPRFIHARVRLCRQMSRARAPQAMGMHRR